MKVILLQDIAKIGKKFDVKELPNGHATYLMRAGKVELATAKKLAKLAEMKKKHKRTEDEKQNEIDQAIAKIKDSGIRMVAKANSEGGLFEGITAVKLQEAIADSIVELPLANIILPEPIKEVGEYVVELTNGDKITKVTLVISAEK